MSGLLASATAEVHNELPMEPFFFGVVAMAVFILLAVVTWSYRDVANRHDHRVSGETSHH